MFALTLKNFRFPKMRIFAKKRKNADEAIYQKINHRIILKGIEEIKNGGGIIIDTTKN